MPKCHFLDLSNTVDKMMHSYLEVVRCINDKEPVPYVHLKQVCSSKAEVEEEFRDLQQSQEKGTKKTLSDLLLKYVEVIMSQPIASLLNFKAVWCWTQNEKSEQLEEEFPDSPFSDLVKKFEEERNDQVLLL